MSKNPPLFHTGEDKLAKLRQQAMDAELRRYLRIEARYKFQDFLREQAKLAGTSVDDLLDDPASKQTTSADLLHATLDVPRILVAVVLYMAVGSFGIWFLLMLWTR